MSRSLWPHCIVAGFVVVGAVIACGSPAPNSSTAPKRNPRAATGSAEAKPGSAQPFDMAPRPDPAPTSLTLPRRLNERLEIGDLASAEQALRQGYYSALEQAIPAIKGSRSSPADKAQLLLLEARLAMVRGRYPEALSATHAATRAARGNPSLRNDAETLGAEAMIAQGKRSEAQSTLSRLAQNDGATRAQLLLGLLHQAAGRQNEAEQALMQLIEAYNSEAIGPRDAAGLAYVAAAAAALDSPQDANDAFQQSTKAAPKRIETQLWWARLFLDKKDAGHAEESVMQALRENPEHPEAHALMARIRIEQSLDFANAEKELDRAMEVNPNLVMALVTRAGMALRDRDFASTKAHLERALKINPRDLEALSVRVAQHFVASDDTGFERAKRDVQKQNPRFGPMYRILDEFAEWEHRYPELVQLARKRLAQDPEDAHAHATLGLNLLRMGDETAGLAALRAAWDRDRFNVRVFNTLNLYDDIIASQYEEVSTPAIIFRFHKEERAILERYVPRTLEKAFRAMRARYKFRPEGPIRFELFADPEHFSLRTAGLPNLGVQGVCFGKVVTAISPRGGPFNWGQITWHELAHIFHIQLSRNRVPRWFTEGLAEYETMIARPEWQRELDHELWSALHSDRLPPLRLMNQAFTRARSAHDMMTAYYASSQIAKYIVEQYGFDRVVRMLRGWGAGKQTADVVQNALGISVDELDRKFRAHSRTRMAARAKDFRVDFNRYADLDRYKERAAKQSNATRQAELAAAWVAAGNRQKAATAAQRALSINDKEPIAHFVMAHVDRDRAEFHLRHLLADGHNGYEVRLLLARAMLRRKKKDLAAVQRELEAAQRIDSARPEAWLGLREVARRTKNRRLRLRALTKLAQIDEHNPEINAELLDLLRAREQWGELVRFGEMGRFLTPGRVRTHAVLGAAYLRTNRAQDALFEYDTALLASPEQPGPVYLGRARALMALRRFEDAKKSVKQAVAADAKLSSEGNQILNRHP